MTKIMRQSWGNHEVLWEHSWENHGEIMRKVMRRPWGISWGGGSHLKARSWISQGALMILERVRQMMRQSWGNHEEIMSKSWRKSWGKSWDSHEKYHETAIEKEKKREKRTKVEKQKRVRIRSVRMRIMGGAPWETICDLRLLLAVRINGRYSIPPFRTSLNISEPKPPIK